MRRLIAVLIISLGWALPLYAGTAFYDPIYGYSTTSNIVYGTGLIDGGASSFNLLLDLYRPTDIGGGALPDSSPGIVLIHGGGFVGGSKSEFAPLAQAYATYGYTVTSINYRLFGQNVPANTGPADNLIAPPPPFLSLPAPEGAYAINAAVEDASKAMAWMRDNAALYDIDSDHIAIGGGSAGAITSLLQAYISPAANVAPQAVISLVGAMYGTEGSIHAGSPPAFVVNSSNDPDIPFSSSQAMVDQMNAVGVYNEFYVQTIGHAVDFFADFGGQTLFEHNMEFLAQVLVPEPSSLVLGGLAALALVAVARRKRRATRMESITMHP